MERCVFVSSDGGICIILLLPAHLTKSDVHEEGVMYILLLFHIALRIALVYCGGEMELADSKSRREQKMLTLHLFAWRRNTHKYIGSIFLIVIGLRAEKMLSDHITSFIHK